MSPVSIASVRREAWFYGHWSALKQFSDAVATVGFPGIGLQESAPKPTKQQQRVPIASWNQCRTFRPNSNHGTPRRRSLRT